MEAKAFEKKFCIGRQTVLLPDYSQVDAVQLPSGLVICEMLVTPDLAKQWLNDCANPNNRSVKATQRSLYVSDMENGMWDTLTTDNAITFDEDGILKNGHHRLEAIAKSGVPIKMIIYLEASRNIKIFDKGTKRTTIDSFVMQGVDRKLRDTTLVAIVNHLIKKVISSAPIVSDLIIRAYAENHSSDLVEAVRIVKCGCGERYCKTAQIGSVVYCALRYGVDVEKLERFCTVVNTGIASESGYTSALYLYQYAKAVRDARRGIVGGVSGSSQDISSVGLQLVGERALSDCIAGVERKIKYDPLKIKPGKYTEYVKKQDEEEVAHLVGGR